MKAEPDTKLDEQSITEAAEAALSDLQLDAGVASVTADGESWCVRFTADYGQFCDNFQDPFGKENGFQLIREKIKRHLLKQQQNKIRAGVRIRRGKPEPRRPAGNLLETAVKTIGGVASQTAGFAADVINQAMSLPETALRALETAVETVPDTASPASEPLRQPAPPQSLARVQLKMAATESAEKSSRAAHQATPKEGSSSRKAATQNSKAATESRKPAAAKSASKSITKPASKSSKTATESASKSTKSASKSSKSTAKPSKTAAKSSKSAAKKSRAKQSLTKRSSRKR